MSPMIPKEMKYNLHCGDVRGDVLPPPYGTNTSSNEVCNTAYPFDAVSHPEEILLNISSGLHAPQDVQQSLLSAVKTGEKKFVTFVKETLSTRKGKQVSRLLLQDPA